MAPNHLLISTAVVLGAEPSDPPGANLRFKDAGGVMHSKPVRLDGLIAIYCRDPFGNIIELMQPLDGTS